jgi:hypothetical protein
MATVSPAEGETATSRLFVTEALLPSDTARGSTTGEGSVSGEISGNAMSPRGATLVRYRSARGRSNGPRRFARRLPDNPSPCRGSSARALGPQAWLMDGDCLAAGKGYGDVQFFSPPRAEHRKDDSVGSDTSRCLYRATTSLRTETRLRQRFRPVPSIRTLVVPSRRTDRGLMDVQPRQVRRSKRATESNAGIGYPEDERCLR